MTEESAGSKASALTAMFGRKSVTACHDAPPSTVFQTPPETAPAYMTLESCGSIRSARVRPPMLPGPRNCHDPGCEVAWRGLEVAESRGAPPPRDPETP